MRLAEAVFEMGSADGGLILDKVAKRFKEIIAADRVLDEPLKNAFMEKAPPQHTHTQTTASLTWEQVAYMPTRHPT